MATSAFGKAFRAARDAGDKTFEFGGKKYTTQMASEVEQPSVGGKTKAGEYKTRAPYGDRGRKMTEDNYVRRDMANRMEEIDSETQGDDTSMKYVPRDRYDRQGQQETSDNYRPRYTPPTQRPKQTTGDEVTYMRKGGSVSASRRADGIAQRGKTRGKMV